MSFCLIILAGGNSHRFKSNIGKPYQKIAGKSLIEINIDKQHEPKIIQAKKTSSKYRAKTVNILNKNPNEANIIVHLIIVILLLKFINCFFHSGGICFS